MEIKYDSNFISFNQSQLKLMKEKIKEINFALKNLKEDIINALKSSEQLEKKILSFEEWMSQIHKYTPEENDKYKTQNYNNISEEFENFYKYNSNIINYLTKFKDLNIENFKISNDFLFYKGLSLVENIKFFSNIQNELNLTSKSFLSQDELLRSAIREKKSESYDLYEENIINEEKKEENKYLTLKCYECNKNAKAIFMNELFCDDCLLNLQTKQLNLKDLDFPRYLQEKEEKEIKITLFLNSIAIIIKRILIKSNYIIKKRLIFSQGINNNNQNIIQNIDYPYIKVKPNYDTCLNFIKDIFSLYKNLSGENNVDHKLFVVSNLDNRIIMQLKNIFRDNKFNSLNALFSELDFKYFSSESESEINVINEIISENNNIIYFSAKDCLQHIDSLIKNKNEKRNINNSTSKNSLVNNQSSKNKTKTKSEINNKKKKENLSLSEYTYLFECLSKKDTKRNNLTEKEIIRKMKTSLENFKYLKYLFLDFLITTKIFFELPLKEIIYEFPSLSELYPFKILIEDLIINELQLKDYIDIRGNLIMIEKQTIKLKGKKEYLLPPSGWVGVGIKINEENINDNEWINTYISFGKNLSSNELKELLKEIIKNGFNRDKIQLKDIYLNLSFSKILVNSGIISFYNKNFRVVLMAKIKLNDGNFDIFDNNNIRIYSLLLKRID